MPENLEALNRVARSRYGQDLQGATKRMFFNAGDPATAGLDFEGICKAQAIWPIWTTTNHDTLLFFLSSQPAP
jgi:hypothetical protein